MSNLFIAQSYVDVNGKNLLWDNSIHSVLFYDSGSESWDRYNSGASWFLEDSLPYDSFYGSSLDNDRWSPLSYRGSVGVSVSNGLFLTISGSRARGGISSSGKWKILGDFDIRVYVNENSYYNEYRGSSATGLTLSFSESSKIRVSKYFSREQQSIGHAIHRVSNYPLKQIGWERDFFSSAHNNLGDTTCLRFVREGSSVQPYVGGISGFHKLGSSFDGEIWEGSLDIEIEVESEDFNYYSSCFSAFTISGTLVQDTVFDSDFRGPKKEFPEKSLILVDTNGMSIVDTDNNSLWMRFNLDPTYMFTEIPKSVAASDGRVYCTSENGLFCFDFVNDKAVRYNKGKTYESLDGLANRNNVTLFSEKGSNSFILDDSVVGVASNIIEDTSFVAVSTSSGVGLLIDYGEEKVESSPGEGEGLVYMSEKGTLYWNKYDSSQDSGSLFYREHVSNLIGSVGSYFASSGYYSRDTFPFQLSYEKINDIYAISDGKFVVSHDFGIDFFDGSSIITYGSSAAPSVVEDGVFDNFVGVSWTLDVYSMFAAFNIGRSEEWFTKGNGSIKFSLLGSSFVYDSNYGGIYQYMDLTGVDKLFFDLRSVNSGSTENGVLFLVLVSNEIVFSRNSSEGSYNALNSYIDVSSFTGQCKVFFAIKSLYSGETIDTIYFFVDNVRTYPVEVEYPIIPSMPCLIKKSLLWYEGINKKIFFASDSGYGALDLSSNTLDFFVRVEGVVPSALITAVEYKEEVSVI